MSVARVIPKRIRDQQDANMSPGAGTDGYAIVYNHGTGKFELGTFEAAGAGATAVAAHVALSDPHTQYALESALGTAAAYNVGTGANNIVQLDGSGLLPAVDGSQLTNLPGGGAVAGSTTQVIFNDAGAYAGDAGLTYAKATDRLTVAGGIITPNWRPASDSTTALQLQNAAGTAVVTVDTTNRRVGITSLAQHIRLYYAADVTKFCSFYANSAGTLGVSATSGQVEYYDGTNSYFFRVFSANNENVRMHSNGTSWFAGGNIGIGQSSGITALLDLAASTTARASLRVRAGTAPTTPNAGDIWYATGGRLSLYRAAAEIFATGVQATGGSATAGATWTSTEQDMLQKIYDAGRAFGLLS